MTVVHADSLSATVDAVNDAFFFGRKIPKQEALRAARFISSRRALPRAYHGTFALFDDERTGGIRAFTGERLIAAGARHIIGEESCRALLLLNMADPKAQEALSCASTRLQECVGPARRETTRWGTHLGGMYCCGRCTVSLWRHLTVGGMDDQERRLAIGLRHLRAMRKGDSQWRTFPFWYTLSALIEMDGKAAREELRYAAPRCESAARRAGKDRYAARRSEIARRALARI